VGLAGAGYVGRRTESTSGARFPAAGPTVPCRGGADERATQSFGSDLPMKAMLDGPPAIRGGRPAFPEGLPLARPSVPDPDRVVRDVRIILESGVLTNGPYVAEFERRAAEYLRVRHCVAVSSCTSGLMLVLRAAGLSGDVILPSFTFAATAHAVAWNGLRPAFVDVDPRTLTLSPATATWGTGMRTSAILATHTYGTPCDVEGLAEAAERSGIRLFYDAAHAFGSRHDGRPMGSFGDAEVFSLTPTKPVVAGEGGIIATNDEDLAEDCRIGREYGKEPDYDSRFVGLNARMSEFHAAVALTSLDGLDERIADRNRLAGQYREGLGSMPGISFPEVRSGDLSTYKDFTILVDAQEFGVAASSLAEALTAEGIEVRRYYSPPVHRMRPYRNSGASLPVTDHAASRVVTLPLWVGMTDDHVVRVAEVISRIRASLAGVEAS
jgi:dTDP-4-amino-4,6-dideoxygalactose transaminase